MKEYEIRSGGCFVLLPTATPVKQIACLSVITSKKKSFQSINSMPGFPFFQR
jgi:hypothetical protein